MKAIPFNTHFCVRIFLWIFSILLLKGCVTIPNLDQEQKLTHQISLDPSLDEALSSSYFQEGNWIEKDWWEMFHDPQLGGLIALALRESPTIKKVAARMESAYQGAKKEKSLLFPEVDGEAQTDWEHYSAHGFFRAFAPTFPAVVNDITLALNFSYELDFWGKNRHLFKAALGLAEAQKAEVASAKLILSTSVARAYFELQANLAKLTVYRELLRQRSSLYQLTRQRYEHGLSTQIEISGSEKEILITEKSVLLLEQEVAVNRHLLKVLIGLEPDGNLEMENPSASFPEPFPLPENLSANLLSRRPDLMAQIWRVEAAAHEIGAAKTAFYPNVNLVALLGTESVKFPFVFSPSSRSLGLTPAITLPIFTGGRLKANLAGKQADFDEAVYAYNELVLQAAQEVADRLTILKSVNDRLRVQKETVKTVERTYDLTYSRFKQAIDSYLNVLQAEGGVLDQRLVEVELKAQHLIGTLDLIQAIGGGYDGQ